MAEAQHQEHRKWIREFLVPNLIENNKLVVGKISKENFKLESIEIKNVSIETTFMLSICYFVNILICISKDCSCENNNCENSNEVNLVVKVIYLCLFG